MENLHEPAIRELEAKLAELELQADGFRASIKALRSLSANGNPIGKAINKAIPLGGTQTNVFGGEEVSGVGRISAVYNAISSFDRFVKIPQIATSLNIDGSKVRIAISTLLANKKVTKVQVTTSNQDTFWGLPEWKDGDNVKAEHMYDKSDVVGSTLK